MNVFTHCACSKWSGFRLWALSLGALPLCASLAVSAAQASEIAESVQIHGFATQGYTLTSRNNFFGSSRGSGSLKFRELGINGSVRASARLHLAAQAMSRRAGGTDDGHLRLDYGLVDYRFISDVAANWGLRVGRVKNPIGFYNDTRDVAFTRPSVILPQSLYFDRVRDIQLSSDGAQLYGEGMALAGDFNLQIQFGQPRAGESNTEIALLGGDRVGSLEAKPSWLGRISYDFLRGRLRFAYSEYRLLLDYSAAAVDPNGPGAIKFRPRIFSAQYNQESWSLTAEYARRRFDFETLTKYVPFTDVTGESYYAQASYRLTPKWEVLARYDVLYQNKEDRTGETFEAITRGTRPAHSQFAKNQTITVSWTPSDAWMIRAEHHWIDGTAWLPIQDNSDSAAIARKWTLFTLLASVRF